MRPLLFLICIFVFESTTFSAAPNLKLPENFPQFVDVPAIDQWTLSENGKGKRGKKTLEILGDGTPDFGSWWVSPNVTLEPGKTYRFTVDANATKGGSGSSPCGPDFANRDYLVEKSEKDTELSHVFRVPDNTTEASLRLGQWSSDRTFIYHNPKIEPTVPLYHGIKSIGPLKFDVANPEQASCCGDFLRLGDGESIRNGVYKFQAAYDHYGSNDHRPLWCTTTGFNSDRWTFGGGNEVVYKFDLTPIRVDIEPEKNGQPGAIRYLSGKCSVGVNYHIGGKCLLSVSRDGNDWTPLGSVDKVGQIDAVIPGSFFPADTLYLKIQADSNASFQVNRVTLESPTDCKDYSGIGKTLYPTIRNTGFFAEMVAKTEIEPLFFANSHTWFRYSNKTDEPIPAKHGVCMQSDRLLGANGMIPAKSHRFLIVSEAANRDFVRVDSTSIVLPGFSFRVKYDTPEYHKSVELPLVWKDDAAFLTWAYPEQKLPPVITRPGQKSEPVHLFAAKNEYESMQILVNAQKTGIHGLTASISDLTTEAGARIAASNVEIRTAYYHFVETPTDKTGVSDFWPDALIPLDKPVDVEAGRRLPIWFTVYVPEDAPAGDYAATITMKSTTGIDVSFPLQLHVWNFAIPKTNTLETAFGLGWHRVFQYHNCKTEADKRAVIELYLENYGKHRVSIYNPTPLDPIRVKWNTQADPPQAELDFTAFDQEMERVLGKYRFTSFVIPIHGMGGGTYESRTEPSIEGFTKETPQFKALFASYATQLEQHLIEKGWIDKAYVYWFDEPDPKDYQFVADGFGRLSAVAPKIRKMITEEPSDGFLNALKAANTKIDLWCPVSYNYDAVECDKRLAAGEELWWYVCTGPKEPYCTLFIDHPGVELRIWHWQAFQRGITGSLVWESCWWTSDTAFPDTPQNPYEDPMGYVASGAIPKGTKQNWGNGDGRFVYPPLDAAMPGRNDGKPILLPPNSSIRWEMIRDGIEDYETLRLLAGKVKDKDKLLELTREVSKGLTDFTHDPQTIRKVKQLIAEMIEKE